MLHRIRFVWPVAIGVSLLSAVLALGEDGSVNRLQAADASNVLDASGMKPWHLKLTVQLFDAKGKPLDHGTIEERWGGGMDRIDYSMEAYQSTQIRRDGKVYRTKGTGTAPYLIELLRMQAVHPMPKTDEVLGSKPELRKLSFGKVTLDCITLTQPIKRLAFAPLGLFPTYCFDPGKDALRASYEFGNQAILRNRIGSFQGKTVALDVSVVSGGVVIASSQIITLAAADINENEMTPTAGEGPHEAIVPVASAVMMAGALISKPDPVYPESAKSHQIEGKVILHAEIGTDGRIHSLKLISADDPDLAISAIAAVRQWVYKPYLLNGEPSDVETTITVNFNFERR